MRAWVTAARMQNAWLRTATVDMSQSTSDEYPPLGNSAQDLSRKLRQREAEDGEEGVRRRRAKESGEEPHMFQER